MALSPVERAIFKHARASIGGIEPNTLWNQLCDEGHKISIDQMFETIHGLAIKGMIEPGGRGTSVVRVKGQKPLKPAHSFLCDCPECLHDDGF